MSSSLASGTSRFDGATPRPVLAEAGGERVPAPEFGEVRHRLLTGTSALALAVAIERGTCFVANIIAARLGGASTFGTYSLAISTANNIATYAGAGIGSTAARFSGKYQYGASGYAMLARVLTLVSVASALIAATGLWFFAGPIARLLSHLELVGLLHWTAISAAGIVVLECARGFFIGQRRLTALVLMSLIVGGGTLLLLPIAAHHHSPVRMITSQGAITLTAVLVCLLLARPLGLFPPPVAESQPAFGSIFREVAGFGFVQLAGLIGTNAAGWWLITLVARADGSFVQMSLFGIASQLRNIVGLAPSLLTESSIAVMADPEGESSRTPQHVLGFTTFCSSIFSFAIASVGILIAPWMLRLLYSSAYSQATPTVAFALALAVTHMGNAPASARLSVISIRASGIINTVWALFVASIGTALMFHAGSAAMAMVVYLAAHAVSSALVLTMLARKDSLPQGMVATYSIATVSATVLAGLAALRTSHPQAARSITEVMLLLFVAAFAALIGLGRRYQWMPTRAAIERIAAYVKNSIRSSFVHVFASRSSDPGKDRPLT